jgi:hypothetical protein
LKVVIFFPNRGFHPLAPRPNPNEIMGIIRKHFLNCLGISGNAWAIVEISFGAYINEVGGLGVKPPVRACEKLAPNISVLKIRLGWVSLI